jgi:hypothetical protein
VLCQTEQHRLVPETMKKKIVVLYDDPSLIKNKVFMTDLLEENLEFLLLKGPETLTVEKSSIKNRISPKIKKKIPLSHRSQTIDQMNKKELKKLVGCDFCQSLTKYEKEKIKAERIKND